MSQNVQPAEIPTNPPKRIRNSAKAMILRDGCLLVSKIVDEDYSYYVLPGGGQEPDEILSDTVVRECAEELGVRVEAGPLLFIVERTLGEDFHRIDFIFECRDTGEKSEAGLELDVRHAGYEWLPVDTLDAQPFYPVKLRTAVRRFSNGELSGIYLGHDD
jgi:8-oxo-dGTP pyrophosphatase MutT (NUDIX family)